MNLSTYQDLHVAFEKHSVVFGIQKGTMLFYGVMTNIVLVFTIYVMKTSRLELATIHRILMYCNILFPAIFCNTTCFIFVPYIVVPYSVIATLGPMSFGPSMTMLHMVIFCWFGTLSSVSIFYSVTLNYISVFHHSFLSSSIFSGVKVASIFIPILMLVVPSVILPYSLLSEPSPTTTVAELYPSSGAYLVRYSAVIVHYTWHGVELGVLGWAMAYTTIFVACGMMITKWVLVTIIIKLSER
ncbi:unnamed protein product [Cylicostephanus goldi]|uniref:Uncharacterized protein n=1 Tax=Cylicostephanus goldi TaxID=71465 RepID=A0A3P6RYR0_CYLGO|nr:unnamed protein product [Cylicostephanus goldi]